MEGKLCLVGYVLQGKLCLVGYVLLNPLFSGVRIAQSFV
jgi:hypothetical protein